MLYSKSLIFGLLACLVLNCTASEKQPPTEKNKAMFFATADSPKKSDTTSKYSANDALRDLSKNLDDFIEISSSCLEKEEIKTSICIVHDLEKLGGEKNNYIAQHMLGNIYEKRDSFKLSLQWYELALSNKNLPHFYKPQVQADYERTRLKVFSK